MNRDQIIRDICVTRKLILTKSMDNSIVLKQSDIDEKLYSCTPSRLEEILKAEKKQLINGRKNYFN